MRTAPSISSLIILRSSTLVLGLAACAADGDEATVVEPAAPSANAVAVAPSEPPQPTVAPTLEPPPTPPEPEPAPPANAAPATLRLSAHGRCKHLGVSAVGDQTFLHYRFGDEHGFVHRLDPHGALVETLRFDEGFWWDEKNKSRWDMQRYSQIRKISGRWPDQLVLQAVYLGREHDYSHLYRRVDDGWKRIETLGREVNYWGAWPWRDGSILAWGDSVGYADAEYNAHPPDPRLAIVRGEGKGPSLAELRKRSRCEPYELVIDDVHVRDDGKVTALASCGGTWIGSWTPDDLQGTVQRVAPGDRSATLHLDARGQGFILAESKLIAWDGTTATPVRVPGNKDVGKVFMGRDGEAWILQGKALSRRTADGWEPAAVPSGAPTTHVAGLEHGTPWLLHADDTVSMQTADGAWHAVPLLPTPDLHKVPKATTIHVLAPGDAWIEGTYFKMNKGSKQVGKPFWAAFTTRDAPTTLECGKEPLAAPPSPSPTTEQPQ